MAGEKYLNESANSDSYPNFGLPVSTSIAVNSVVTANLSRWKSLEQRPSGSWEGR